MLTHVFHRFTGCSTPPPGPPPCTAATAVHINRWSVLNGRVVSAYAKQPPVGANAEDLQLEWTNELVTTPPAAVAATAREGARRIGLDYAGVGMSEQTHRSPYAHLQQTLHRRLRRAS